MIKIDGIVFGPEYPQEFIDELMDWMESNGYTFIGTITGPSNDNPTE